MKKNRMDFESKVQVRPLMTWILICINICIYLAMTESFRTAHDPQMIWIRWGAVHPLSVWLGEIWRLFTAIFLHGNVVHLALNCFVLLQIGRLLEMAIGPSRFMFVFVVSGIVGFALSLIVNGSIAIGSSGAVFGLVGALLGIYFVLPREVTDRKLLHALLWFVAINVVFGLLINLGVQSSIAIDNMAHIGGLVTGVLLGMAFAVDTPWMQTREKKSKNWQYFLGWTSLFCSFALLFGTVALSIRPSFLKDYHYQMGLYALGEKDFARVKKSASMLMKAKGGQPFAEILRGRMAVQKQDNEAAKSHFELALKEIGDREKAWQILFANPYQTVDVNELLFVDEVSNKLLCDLLIDESTGLGAPHIFNDCAWLLLMAKDARARNENQALIWAKKAAQLSKGLRSEILHTLAQAYAQNGQIDEAIIALDRAMLQSREGKNYLADEKRRLERLAINAPHNKWQ